jgi:hypothetical protein
MPPPRLTPQQRKSLRAQTRAELQQLILKEGIYTLSEADETASFMDELADREMSGDITPEQAMQQLVEFGLAQLRKRAN